MTEFDKKLIKRANELSRFDRKIIKYDLIPLAQTNEARSRLQNIYFELLDLCMATH